MFRISIWTVVFLVLLRLAIGWHFLFEGLHKVHSTYSDRPFSSAGYFREAEGPLGAWMRRFVVGDADAEALERLTPVPAGPDSQPQDRFPPALARDWQAYLDRFVQFYQLSDAQRDEARKRLQQSTVNTALWLEGKREKSLLTVKDTFQGVTAEVKKSVPQRVQDYRELLREVREQYDRKLPLFGRDVEKARLRELKAKAVKLRTELLDELDKQTREMKQNLAAIVRLPQDGWLPVPFPEGTPPEQALLALLTPAKRLFPTEGRVNPAEVLPPDLNSRWDEYLKLFEVRYRLDEDQKARAADLLAQAKERAARWLTDAGEVKTGLPQHVAEFRGKYEKWQASGADPSAASALRADLDKSAEGLRKELDAQTVGMKQSLAGVLDEDQKEAFAPPPKERRTGTVLDWPQWNGVERLDWLTRWGLVVMGGGLLLGLLTRLNCLAAAGFLALTYLATPALAYLPAAPMSEGNYFIVNKNVVELLALLALATTASGQWFGVDRLLCATWRLVRGPKTEV
jgi:uncharacterized membrane protein YphA (DoxX/SURF4 family)